MRQPVSPGAFRETFQERLPFRAAKLGATAFLGRTTGTPRSFSDSASLVGLPGHTCPAKVCPKCIMTKTGASIWWSVTAYNGEIELLEKGKLPDWVKTVYGGKEECPDTKRIHFQGAIQCHSQQVLGRFKEWLPTAHMEIARKVQALKNYAMKSETAVGEKLIRHNTVQHLTATDACMMLARQSDPQSIDDLTMTFYERVNRILMQSPELAGQFMNPSLRNFYEKTHNVWAIHVKTELEEEQVEPQDNLL